jgi:hypothetical protein
MSRPRGAQRFYQLLRSGPWLQEDADRPRVGLSCRSILGSLPAFRCTGSDDNGNALRRVEASSMDSFPCRHCLRCAALGETMLRGSYNLPRPRGIYWTPSPIFLHAESCARFASENEVAPIVRSNALVSVRAYDEADQCIYELGQVCPGGDVDAPLERALGDARCAFVNIHTARPGLPAFPGGTHHRLKRRAARPGGSGRSYAGNCPPGAGKTRAPCPRDRHILY